MDFFKRWMLGVFDGISIYLSYQQNGKDYESYPLTLKKYIDAWNEKREPPSIRANVFEEKMILPGLIQF